MINIQVIVLTIGIDWLLLVECYRSIILFCNVIDNCAIDKHEARTNEYHVLMIISTIFRRVSCIVTAAAPDVN